MGASDYIAAEKLLLAEIDHDPHSLRAAHLLESLPSAFPNEDEGIGEALRRDADLDASPSLGTSLEQLDQQIERRRS